MSSKGKKESVSKKKATVVTAHVPAVACRGAGASSPIAPLKKERGTTSEMGVLTTPLKKDRCTTGEPVLKIASQKDTLMHSLITFFHKRDHINELLPIIEGQSNISLRILDWFVTNYSKKHGVSYQQGDKRFMVYVSYKAQLKAYQKKNFDPFCRRERIKFIVHGGKEVITTVGQLNFFRWAIDNKILKYIDEHYDEIEKDMNDSLKNMYKKKEDEEKQKRRKRRQLSVSAVKTVNKHNTSIIVSFN